MREIQSDRILELVESSIQVESEIETHTNEVAEGLEEDMASIFRAWGEELQKPDFRATLKALKDKLGGSRETLISVEERHIDLIRQAVELRGEREELSGSLYDDFSSMRRTVEELYRGKGKGNPSAFVVAGIQGPTGQKPAKLLRQVDLATKHLRKPDLVFPVSRFGGTPLEPRKLAKVLEPRAKRLSEVRDELQKVASEMKASRRDKERAIESHKKVFSWVTGAAESYFHLAGEHELAERIRPATRRKAAEDAKGKEAEAGASPDDGIAADASAEAASGEVTPDSLAGESQATTESVSEG